MPGLHRLLGCWLRGRERRCEAPEPCSFKLVTGPVSKDKLAHRRAFVHSKQTPRALSKPGRRRCSGAVCLPPASSVGIGGRGASWSRRRPPADQLKGGRHIEPRRHHRHLQGRDCPAGGRVLPASLPAPALSAGQALGERRRAPQAAPQVPGGAGPRHQGRGPLPNSSWLRFFSLFHA